ALDYWFVLKAPAKLQTPFVNCWIGRKWRERSAFGHDSVWWTSSRSIACLPRPKPYISVCWNGGSPLLPETRYTAGIMREILSSIEGEWRRYKVLAERALEQTRDEELTRVPSEGANSIAVIVTHIAGNLKSRFTNFLTDDGEKPWRDRDAEFEPRP